MYTKTDNIIEAVIPGKLDRLFLALALTRGSDGFFFICETPAACKFLNISPTIPFGPTIASNRRGFMANLSHGELHGWIFWAIGLVHDTIILDSSYTE
ncbi:hypothetical protein CTI12_AA090290 [Artemisia annua]|uniref:Uncharacterized protein n=1 Tax=Artemisia annua TaxID=35608 RepID=A0A2U1Q0E4_ARTAN|nr:hypothetical protein CTI12_AA090290 [Artemisia annua]